MATFERVDNFFEGADHVGQNDVEYLHHHFFIQDWLARFSTTAFL